jgi:hypothetical protein
MKITIASDMALKFSQIMITYAEHNPHNPNVHAILHIAHSFWSVWYQSKCWAGRPDHQGPVVMCEAWVLLSIQVLTERLKEDPSNGYLNVLFHCFTSRREVVIEDQKEK